ncbi:MAG: YkgJ family cysteine cluster protein [Magnetococcales bacterium]|uniref:YkgJ family cysteine cluster protein n=1 Tax=Candidatus Magnetobacterium casense TaxID=1455061 RepID=A0ABS6RU00_9BACT|nr:YkgJ family cysteine cluster protein [Candidatus Magnetobacterium casensis]MBF0608107.1 YkgJ family cysteine cluster protein [Nitrospirota bacterium]MBV6340097.1 YkgJ family cysteine cluster protein [Candidatus Magnetobacterium casensis]
MQLGFDRNDKGYPWLSVLLDGYEIIDEGVEAAIRAEVARGTRHLACHKGCGNCCISQRDIPVYPHEVAGIYWYVSEKMPQHARSVLMSQLEASPSCPFLGGQECLIHAARPVSCRVFNVFGSPCQPDEDPFYTRQFDVLIPPQQYINEAFYSVMPFYGVKDRYDRMDALEDGLIHSKIMNLKSYNWKELFSESGDDK